MVVETVDITWLMAPDVPDVDTLASLVNRPAWMARAACRGTDTGAFFPGRGETLEAVRGVCDGCPVRAECLDFAMADPEIVGMWGGTSARERMILRREAG